ncbi:hypothetical protein KJ785_01350 [Patescibacteria group bacterium]|nr:hypothetical protein [Patescibacteria group bacterium]
MQEAQENKYHYLVALMLAVVGLLIILIFVSMRSAAEENTGLASATITNTSPSITSLDISDAAGDPYNETTNLLTLNEQTTNDVSTPDTDTITLTVNYTDNNSCTEVETGGTFLVSSFDNGVNTYVNCDITGESNEDNCYFSNTLGVENTITCADAGCDGTESDTTGIITCEVPATFYTDPGDWTFYASVADAQYTVTSSMSFSVGTVAAIGLIDTTLDFGNMGLGATSTANAVSTQVRNTGNSHNLTLGSYTASNFNCSGSTNPILLTSLKISTTTNIGYESKPFSSAATQASLGQTVAKQIDGTYAEGTGKETLYWGLLIPSTGVAGTCTTTVTVVGT